MRCLSSGGLKTTQVILRAQLVVPNPGKCPLQMLLCLRLLCDSNWLPGEFQGEGWTVLWVESEELLTGVDRVFAYVEVLRAGGNAQSYSPISKAQWNAGFGHQFLYLPHSSTSFEIWAQMKFTSRHNFLEKIMTRCSFAYVFENKYLKIDKIYFKKKGSLFGWKITVAYISRPIIYVLFVNILIRCEGLNTFRKVL